MVLSLSLSLSLEMDVGERILMKRFQFQRRKESHNIADSDRFSFETYDFSSVLSFEILFSRNNECVYSVERERGERK